MVGLSELGTFYDDGSVVLELCTKLGSNVSYSASVDAY